MLSCDFIFIYRKEQQQQQQKPNANSVESDPYFMKISKVKQQATVMVIMATLLCMNVMRLQSTDACTISFGPPDRPVERTGTGSISGSGSQRNRPGVRALSTTRKWQD
ncbi:uncharacterized protein LOC144615080 isoform X2 [Panthera onca]